ncbi:hypothetical protein PVK06_040089 [Gossypium arboreum]|uniref:Uncharacterized protein n=1 Tax=Gossypium arboreum TaxID=29729 RepID=A0ABR0N4K2_GOSAR|nr:hypothetical protein PVK06_040089 [Gossypium arboreum]
MSKGGSSNKVMTVVLTGSGCVASALKFKRRRVSTVWDFPPDCRRVTAPNFGLSGQITVDRQNAEKPKIWRRIPHERAIAPVVNRAHGTWAYEKEGHHE